MIVVSSLAVGLLELIFGCNILLLPVSVIGTVFGYSRAWLVMLVFSVLVVGAYLVVGVLYAAGVSAITPVQFYDIGVKF